MVKRKSFLPEGFNSNLHEPFNKDPNFIHTPRSTVLKSLFSYKHQCQIATIGYHAFLYTGCTGWAGSYTEKKPKTSENTVLSFSQDTQTAIWARGACKCHELYLLFSKKLQSSPGRHSDLKKPS